MAIRWEEGYASVTDFLKTIAKKMTSNSTDAIWQLHYPASLETIENVFTLKYELKKDATVLNTVYIEFSLPATVSVKVREDNSIIDNVDNKFCVHVSYGTGYTSPVGAGLGTWAVDTNSCVMRYSWFMGDTQSTLKMWLPIQYWISVNEKRIAMVIGGDPSAGYSDRLLSFAYFGMSKPFDDGVEDIQNNFAVCVSSDMSPMEYMTNLEINQYSDRTGTGVTDINMLKTYTGFPMQAHQAALTTPDEFVYKALEGPSSWTKKYHMSPIYVFHGFDGYRGSLDGVVACDKSTIVNLDEMLHKYSSTGGTTPDKQDTYKVFTVNAPFSIFNNASNILYAVAILKKQETI